jgi:hypothetical protein
MMVINSTPAIKHTQRASERRDGRSRDVAKLMRINLGVVSDVACELYPIGVNTIGFANASPRLHVASPCMQGSLLAMNC